MQNEFTRENNEIRMGISLLGIHSNNCIDPIRTINDSNHLCRNDNILLYEKNQDLNEIRRNEQMYLYEKSYDKTKLNINIFRFKFSDDFIEELFKFSKIHQYEERKQFKESWNIWIDENNDIVSHEIKRLTNMGYEGDIIDKMYKSARYYFRKKSTEKKAPTERRDYIGTSKELRDAMDYHIIKNMEHENYKPSEGFDDFCKKNIELLTNEIKQLCKNGIEDSYEIKNKFKKTYKNRYFMIIK